ncbi:DUF916 domain-containing protein [Cellulomonas sp. C5510]|uniref:DUF916 domain-containing protein n=1 Tax=Cellulomonas sp. C5510 TaxID=2871170 RepID=UPI001C945F7E|nr:DUF916 domain-containing protein [Cellulomonas sp. C5510]QZN86849.1 DUF916 domain-containing protein [Cellulomonas sp. C5510]
MTAPTRAALALALLATLVAGPAPAAQARVPAAEGDVTWSVQPSTPAGPDGRTELTYQVAPGTTVTDWVAVSNYSATPATFRVYAADATTDYETGAFTLVGADQASTDLGAWTAVDSAASVCPVTEDPAAEAACVAGLGVEVTVGAGERVDLPVAITVPHDATPGDHAAGVVASYTSTGTDAAGSAVQVAQRVGTRLHLRVDGPLTSVLTVSGAVAGYSGAAWPFGGTAAQVAFDLTNAGNTLMSAEPVVRLTGPFGTDLGTVTLDPVADLVPGGTAHVVAELPGVPPALLLSGAITVTPSGPEDPATPAGEVVTASVRAWAVPWAALGLLVLVAGGVTATVLLRRRSRRLLGEDLAAYADQVRAEALAGRPDHHDHESESAR